MLLRRLTVVSLVAVTAGVAKRELCRLAGDSSVVSNEKAEEDQVEEGEVTLLAPALYSSSSSSASSSASPVKVPLPSLLLLNRERGSSELCARL